MQVTLPKSGSLKEARIQQLLSFHSGAIAGLATSPYSHLAITAGADGTVRLHDYWYVHCLLDLSQFRGRAGGGSCAARLDLQPSPASIC